MAANTQITYRVGFQMDTAEAKKSMQELQSMVKDISSTPVHILDKDSLKDGVQAAQQLEKVLKNAFNVNTGNLDLSKFSSGLKQANMSATQLATSLNNFGPSGQRAFQALANSISSAQLPLKQTSSMVDNLLTNLRKTAQWQISSSIVHGVVGQVKSAIGYVHSLNSSLTDIAIVSDLSSAELAKFAQSAQKMGKALSTSTLDVSNAALIYFQQGDNMVQSLEKAAITIKAANASANSSAQEMSEYLTAVWNSYQVGEKELEKYVDVMAALGAKTATSMEEIATSMQKVAATANTVGVEFDQMSSIIATVSSVTRESAESVGTSFKTILARLGDLKMGNLVEDGEVVKLGLVSSQLQTMGVNILDATGEMRDMGTIIEEIGGKWQGMNSAQKAAVAQTIAGKRQYTQLMALFENWDQYQNNMTIAGDSTGALDKAQETWEKSWTAASGRVKNAMQGIYDSLINEDFAIGFLDTIATIINGVDTLIDKMGGLGSVIALVGGAMGSKLGNKTHEFVDVLKSNLGLMTGQAQRDLAKTQLEMAAASEKSMMGDQRGTFQATNLRTQAKYVRNQDKLSEAQRQDYAVKMEAARAAQERELELTDQKNILDQQSAAQKKHITDNFKKSAEDIAFEESKREIEKLNQEKEAMRARYEELDSKDNLTDDESAEYDAYDQKMRAIEEKKAQTYGDAQQQVRKSLETAEVDPIDIDAWLSGDEAKAAEAGDRIGKALVESIEKNTAKIEKIKFNESLREGVIKDDLKKAQKEIDDINKEGSTRPKADADKIAKETVQKTKARMKLLDKELNAEDGAGQAEYQEVLKGLQADYKDLIQGTEGELSLKVDGVEETQEGLSRLDSLLEAINAKFTEMETKAQNAVNAAQEVLDEGGAGGEAAKFANTEQEKQEVDTKRADAEKERKQREEDANKAAEPIYTISDAVMGATSALAAAYGVGQAFVGMFNTLKDPDATGWEKFSAVLMGLVGVVTGLSGVMQGLNTVTAFAEARQKAKAAATLKAAGADQAAVAAASGRVAAEAAEGAVIEGNTQSHNRNFKAVMKNIGAKLKQFAAWLLGASGATADAAAVTADKIATDADTTSQIANQLARMGVVGAIIAAIAALTALIVYLAKNAKQEETLNEKIEKTNKSIDSHSKKINDIKTNLASLGEALKQTGVTYTEQLETINKISQAFGVQASAIEVLTGDYEMLNKRVSEVAGFDAQKQITESLSDYTTTYSAFADTIDDIDQANDRSFESRVSHTETTFQQALEKNPSDLKFFLTERLSDEAVSSMIRVAGPDYAADGIDKLIEYLPAILADYGRDFFQSADTEAPYQDREENQTSPYFSFSESMMSSEWKNFWTTDATVAEIFEEAGIYLEESADGSGVYLRERYDETTGRHTGDIELLIKSLIQQGIITPGPVDEKDTIGQYFHDLIEEELGLDIGNLATLFSKEAIMGDELAYSNLLNSGKYDMLGLSTTPASLQDVYDLVNEVTNNSTTAQWTDTDRVRTNLAEYLSSNPTYSQSALQYIALGDLATSVIDINTIIEPSLEIDREDVIQQLIHLINEDEGLTVEALLKINPTAIEIDENGMVQITNEAEKQFAIAQAAVEKEQQTQGKYAAIKGIGSKDSLTKDDYQTLWDSGLFESYEELDIFVNQSAAARSQELDFRIAESIRAEADAITAAVPLAEEAYEASKIARDDWVADFELSVEMMERLGARANQYSGKTGFDLVTALEQDRLALETEVANIEKIINGYDAVLSGAMSEEDFLKEYGITLDEGTTLDQYILGQKNLREGKLDAIEDYDAVLAEGDAYTEAMLQAGNAVSKYTDASHAANFAQQQEDLSRLATAAGNYAKAMGQLGTLDLDGLSILELYDPEALDKYRTMTDAEWDEYAYNAAMDYYNQLLAMYDKDSAEYIALMQEKEQVSAEYYGKVAQREGFAAANRKRQMEEELAATENVRDVLSDLLEGKSFSDLGADAIQNLQNSLLELGHDAEEVDAILRNLGKDQNYTDEETIMAAARLQTEMLLADLAKYEEQARNLEADLGEDGRIQPTDVKYKASYQAPTSSSKSTQAEEEEEEVEETQTTTEATSATEATEPPAVPEEEHVDLIYNPSFNSEHFGLGDAGIEYTGAPTEVDVHLNVDESEVEEFMSDSGIYNDKSALKDHGTNSTESAPVETEPEAHLAPQPLQPPEEEPVIEVEEVQIETPEPLTPEVIPPLNPTPAPPPEPVEAVIVDDKRSTQTHSRRTEVEDIEDVALATAQGMPEHIVEFMIQSIKQGASRIKIPDFSEDIVNMVESSMSESVKSLEKNGGALNRFWDDKGNLDVLMSGSTEEISEVWEKFMKTTGGQTDRVWSEIVSTLESALQEYESMMTEFMSDGVMTDLEKQSAQAGQNLILGLMQGVQMYYGPAQNGLIQQCYGLLASMNSTFEIRSPSRATMRMGAYLMQGISEGIANTEVDISPLESKVLAPIRSIFDEFGNDVDGFVEMVQEEFAEMVDPSDLIVANPEDIVYDEQGIPVYRRRKVDVDEYGNPIWENDSTEPIAYREGYTYNGQVYETQALAEEAQAADITLQRASYVTEAGYSLTLDESTGDYLLSADGMDEAINLGSDYGTAVATAYEKALSDKIANKSMYDLFASGFEDTDLADTTKDVLNTIVEDILAENNWTLADIFGDGANPEITDQFWAAFEADSEKVLIMTETQIEATWNKITETWKTSIDAIYQLEEQRAERTLTLWENTYSSIAEMRQKMLEDSDSSITELSSSAEELGNIVTALLQDGWDLADVMKLIAGETVRGITAEQAIADAQPKEYDIDAYMSQGPARWLNATYNDQGEVTQIEDTTYDQMVDNATADVARIFEEEGEYNKEWFEGLDEPLQAALAEVMGDQVEQTEDGEYQLKEGVETLTLSDDTAREIATALLRADGVESQADVDSVIGQAVGVIEDARQTMIDDAVSQGESIITNMQSDQALLEKARDARAKDLTLSDESVLSETEQTRLEELMGAPIEELNDLDASVFADKALDMSYACTEAAIEIRKAIDLIRNGDASSLTYSENEDGTYTIGESEAAQAERAQAAYDRSYEDYGNYQWDTQQAGELWGDWWNRNKEAEAAHEEQRIAHATEQRDEVLSGVTTEQIEGATGEYTGSETLNAAAENTNQLRDSVLELAEAYGLSREEVDHFGDQLQEDAANGAEGLSENLAQNAEAADEAAKEVMRYNRAVEDITAGYEEWTDALKSANKQEQKSAIDKISQAMEDMLDLDFGTLSDDFASNAENIELMKEAAEGSQEAYDKLQAKAAESIYTDKIGEVPEEVRSAMEEIAAIDTVDVGEKIVVGQNAVADGLASLYDNAVLAAIEGGKSVAEAMDIANGIINSVGYNAPEIEMVEKEVTVTGDLPDGWKPQPDGTVTTGPEDKPVQGVKWTKVEGGKYTYTQTMMVPKSTSFTKSSERWGGGSGGGKGGGGGGGGGGGAKKHDKREKPERYHEVTKRYDRVSEALERLQKQQDKTFGATHLKNLKTEADLLKEQIKLLKEKQVEIAGADGQGGYYAQDLADLKKEYDEMQAVLGDFGELELEFDKDRNIQNWEDIEAKITEVWNTKADTKMSDEEWEKIEKAVEEYEKARDQYEETIELMNQNGIEIDELLNAISEKNLEAITYKVEYQVELNEQDLSLLEYYQDVFEDDLGKSAELMANLVSQAGEAEQNLAIISEGIKQLEQDYNTIDAITGEAKINSADFQEGLADLNNQLLDQLEELRDKQKEIEELYADTLDLAQEEMDTHIGQLEHITTVMDKYAEIFDLLGKGTDKAYKDTLFRMKNAANLESIQSQQSMYAELTTRRAEFEAKGVENLTELEKAQYDALLEKIQETHEGLLDTVSEGLTVLQEQYQNTIDMIFEDFEERMLGAGQSIADVADRYAYYQETQNRQLSAAQELYEMSKLNRQIEQSIEDVSTKANKQILKDLQAQIKARNELKDMTQYDIDLMNLQYELALKKMALEEAQNAKSVVRLTRDNDGNYAYQYTADDDKVAQSYQEYEDVLQQINDLAVDRTTELEQMMVDTQQEYYQMAQDIAKDDLLSREEKILKLEELAKRYEETVLYIQEEYGYVNTDLQNNLAATSSWYKSVVIEDTNTAKTQVADMIGNAKTFAEQFTNLLTGEDNSVISAFDDYASAIKTIQDMVETTLTAEGAEAYKTMAEAAGEAALGVVTTLHGELDAINDVTKAWDNQIKKLNEAITAYQTLAAAAIAAQHALGASTTGTVDTSGLGAAASAATEAGAAAMGSPTAPTTPEPESGNETNNQPDGSTGTGTTPPSAPTAPSNTPSTGAITDSVYKQLAEQLNTLLTSLESYAGAAVVLKDSQITYKNITQDIDINAEFPNVENMDDIKMAFEEIAQWASQWANERT